ncbi:MAG: hypothetical protein HY208_04680 [Nitrospirae bacterium]|nr:hypothetical protein [Nitrospirota bacterium]
MIGAEAGGGVWRSIGGVCVLSCGLVLTGITGCGGARSILRPLPETPSTVEITTGLRVTVAPVTAAPELGDDDVALLSRYYSALWVEMRHDAPLPVSVDPVGAIVFDRTGTPWVALNRAQRVQALKWRPWSWRAWTASWMAAGRLERLMDKLDRLQLAEGPLAIGETRRGLLVFRQIASPACQQSSLEWRAGRIDAETGNPPAIAPPIAMVRMAIGC